jgi:hypothetical protein
MRCLIQCPVGRPVALPPEVRTGTSAGISRSARARTYSLVFCSHLPSPFRWQLRPPTGWCCADDGLIALWSCLPENGMGGEFPTTEAWMPERRLRRGSRPVVSIPMCPSSPHLLFPTARSGGRKVGQL